MRTMMLPLVLIVSSATWALAQDEDERNSAAQGGNLVENPSFEKGDTLPDAWSRYALIYREDIFIWSTESKMGRRSVEVSVPPDQLNDARWVQWVSVVPNSEYRLSGWIKTQGVQHSPQVVQAGANLSIYDGVIKFVYTPPLFGDNDWTRVEVEFNTGPETELIVAARVGEFSGMTTGTAWFDGVRLQRIGPRH